MIAGMIGVLKAGGAYVPLDPAYPPERLDYMMEDSGVVAVVTQEQVTDNIQGVRAPVIILESVFDGRCDEEHRPHVEASSGNLAYVIYTSGSTGRPKGVAIAHRSAVEFLHWAMESFSTNVM